LQTVVDDLEEPSFFTPIHFEIWRGYGDNWTENLWSRHTYNFDQLGINPHDPLSLYSREDWTAHLWSWLHSGAYWLRVYVGNVFVAESELVNIEVTEVVQPSRIHPDLFTITVNLVGESEFYSYEHMNNWINDVVNINVTLDADTGLSEYSILPTLILDWLSVDDGLHLSSNWIWHSFTTLQGININPVENLTYSMQHGFHANHWLRVENSGYYVLHISMMCEDGGWYVKTESDPIFLEIHANELPETSIEFEWHFPGTTLTDGEYFTTTGRIPASFDLIVYADMDEITNNLVIPLSWEWVNIDDGRILGHRIHENRQVCCFNSDNPEKLVHNFSATWTWGTTWPVHIHYAGVYRLDVYMDGELIASNKNTFTLNILPDPQPQLYLTEVEFSYNEDLSKIFDVNDMIENFEPIDYLIIDLGGVVPITKVRESSSVSIVWYLDGVETWHRTDVTLAIFNLNPLDAYSLRSVEIPAPQHPLHYGVAVSQFSGEWTLRVYIMTRLVGESEPISLIIGGELCNCGGICECEDCTCIGCDCEKSNGNDECQCNELCVCEDCITCNDCAENCYCNDGGYHSTGGVNFTVQGNNFPTNNTAQSGSTVDMQLRVARVAAPVDATFTATWLRNGTSFGDSIDFTIGTNFEYISLQLPNVSQANHAGTWQLRVTTIVDGNVLFVDYSETSTLTIRGGEPWMPPVSSPEQAYPDLEEEEETEPAPIATPTPRANTPLQNRDEINNQLNAGNENVVLELPEGITNVRLFGRELGTLFTGNYLLTISIFGGSPTLTISPEGMQELFNRASPFSANGTFELDIRSLLEPNGLGGVNLSTTINGVQMMPFNNPEFLITTDIDTSSLNTNYYRITAINPQGNNIGGNYNRETGVFAFTTGETGEFIIDYVQDLRRLILSLDSSNIFDLAQPQMSFTPMDVLPVIQDGITLIPVRFIAEALEFEVIWNPTTEEVTLTNNGQSLTFAIGETLEGMEMPAQLINDRTMIPLRFISEYFDAKVTWNEITNSVEIVR